MATTEVIHRASDNGWTFIDAQTSERIYNGYQLKRFETSSWEVRTREAGQLLDDGWEQSASEAQDAAERAAGRRKSGPLRVAVEMQRPTHQLTPDERAQAKIDSMNFELTDLPGGLIGFGCCSDAADGGLFCVGEVIDENEDVLCRAFFGGTNPGDDARRWLRAQAEFFDRVRTHVHTGNGLPA